MTIPRSSQSSTDERIDQKTNELIEEINELILDCLKNISSHDLSADNDNDHRKQINNLIEFREVLKKSYSDSMNEADRHKDDREQALITNAARYLYLLRNSTQSLDASGKINDPALGLELYRTYRSKIEYEGTLLNQRVNWFLVTQGFLFAAFATALSAEISLPILGFLLIISMTGIGYSSLVSNPIGLSLFAVDTIKEEWKERIEAQLITDQVKNLIPKQVCFDEDDHDINTYVDAVQKKYRYRPKSEKYKGYIRFIPFGTRIIWFILLLVVINSLRSHPYYPTWLFGKNSYYLKIESLNPIIQDRSAINEAKLGLRAAICLTTKDENDSYEKVLAIKPKENLFYNLSGKSANYYDSLSVPVQGNIMKNHQDSDYNYSYTIKNLRLQIKKEKGQLESCE